MEKGATSSTSAAVAAAGSPSDGEVLTQPGEFSVLYGADDSPARQQLLADFATHTYPMGCYASGTPGMSPAFGGWGSGPAQSPWLQASAGQVWREASPMHTTVLERLGHLLLGGHLHRIIPRLVCLMLIWSILYPLVIIFCQPQRF